MFDISVIRARAQVEQAYEFMKWRDQIPSLNFDKDWNVKIIPPFAGAIVRFLVEHNGKHVSCYLDCYDELGYYGEPYWEIYPYENDVFRCSMQDTSTLIEKIREIVG